MNFLKVAFGPEAPRFGSWEWIGDDLSKELRNLECATSTFEHVVPECDIAVFVKFKPSPEELSRIRKSCRIVFCPVDIYDSSASIDADQPSLQQFDQIIVHCDRLRRYFAPYAPVSYLDHHLKYVAPLRPNRPVSGPLLWVGNRSNLPPVIEWVNQNTLPEELWVLTDFENDRNIPSAPELGVKDHRSIRIAQWTAQRHLEWTSLARAAIDVKGNEFRARHKPATKALDFLASGVVLAMNHDSSSVEHLQRVYDFQIADLRDFDYLFSEQYWCKVQKLAPQLVGQLSRSAIASQFLEIVRSNQSEWDAYTR